MAQFSAKSGTRSMRVGSETPTGGAARGLAGRIAVIEIVPTVLTRALDPFPVPAQWTLYTGRHRVHPGAGASVLLSCNDLGIHEWSGNERRYPRRLGRQADQSRAGVARGSRCASVRAPAASTVTEAALRAQWSRSHRLHRRGPGVRLPTPTRHKR
jgi:hypothetical protein